MSAVNPYTNATKFIVALVFISAAVIFAYALATQVSGIGEQIAYPGA